MLLPSPKPKPGTGPLRVFAALLGLAALTLVGPAFAGIPLRQAATPAAGLGRHIVQTGETLYCVGRAYGVRPDAIAAANGLALFAVLTPGQVLTIPAVRWTFIPRGPVCRAQFASPFVSAAPVGTLSAPAGGAGAALTPTVPPGLETKTPQATRTADTKTPSP